MRVHRWQQALARLGAVDVVMVPIAGMAPPSDAIVLAASADEAATGAIELARDPRWRAVMARLDPAPEPLHAAPPWLGRRAVPHLAGRPDVVVAFKAVMGPIALD